MKASLWGFGWMSGWPLLFLYLSLKTGVQTSEEQILIPSIKGLEPWSDWFPLSLGGRKRKGGREKIEKRREKKREKRRRGRKDNSEKKRGRERKRKKTKIRKKLKEGRREEEEEQRQRSARCSSRRAKSHPDVKSFKRLSLFFRPLPYIFLVSFFLTQRGKKQRKGSDFTRLLWKRSVLMN